MSDIPDHVRATVEDKDRLAVLERIPFDPAEDEDFQGLTRLAAEAYDAPSALITVVSDDIQWFRGCFGLDLRQTPVRDAFCAHAIAEPGLKPFIVTDASTDPRFRDNPLVTGEPFIRFYAGVPLLLDGQPLGTLAIIDTKPRALPEAGDLRALSSFAGLAVSLIHLKDRERSAARAEEAVVHATRRHELALRAASIATWEWDMDGDVVESDAALRDMFGLGEGGSLSLDDFISAIEPEDVPALNESIELARSGGGDFHAEFRIRSTGRWLVGMGQVIPSRDAGKLGRLVGVNLDITEQIMRSERERMMNLEINHRVKNTLAVLQSLASQTLRRSRTPEDFLKAFTGRLHAIAATHTLLSDNGWEKVSFGELVNSLVELPANTAKLAIPDDADKLMLDADEALGLGMVLHELVSNAAQHGAFTAPDGLVEIRVSDPQRERGAARIEWVERGGPPLPEDVADGFGLILIRRSLEKVLGSSVLVRGTSDGLLAEIILPTHAPLKKARI